MRIDTYFISYRVHTSAFFSVLIRFIFVEQREVCRLFAGPENHDGVPACTFSSFYNIYFLL